MSRFAGKAVVRLVDKRENLPRNVVYFLTKWTTLTVTGTQCHRIALPVMYSSIRIYLAFFGSSATNRREMVNSSSWK